MFSTTFSNVFHEKSFVRDKVSSFFPSDDGVLHPNRPLKQKLADSKSCLMYVSIFFSPYRGGAVHPSG